MALLLGTCSILDPSDVLCVKFTKECLKIHYELALSITRALKTDVLVFDMVNASAGAVERIVKVGERTLRYLEKHGKFFFLSMTAQNVFPHTSEGSEMFINLTDGRLVATSDGLLVKYQN